MLVAGIYIIMLSTDEILRKCEKWSFTFDIKIKRKVLRWQNSTSKRLEEIYQWTGNSFVKCDGKEFLDMKCSRSWDICICQTIYKDIEIKKLQH